MLNYASEFADISVNDVNTLAASKSAVIIDANGTDSYNAGHVPGALNFAAIKDNLAASLPKDKSALIIAYCGNPKCGDISMRPKLPRNSATRTLNTCRQVSRGGKRLA